MILYVDGDNDPAIAVYERPGFTTPGIEAQYRRRTRRTPARAPLRPSTGRELGGDLGGVGAARRGPTPTMLKKPWIWSG